MKKLFVFLMAFAMVLSLSASVSAADYSAKKGTPVVDGKLDEIYLQSGSVVVDAHGKEVWIKGDNGGKSDVKSTTWMLWDDSYIYFACEAKESTVVDTGILNGWEADAFEVWVNYNGTLDKVSLDAFATKVYGNGAIVPQDKCLYAAAQTDDGYIVELAIPVGDYKAGASIGFSVQINDCIDKGAANIGCWGSQKADDNLILSAAEVEIPQESPATADPMLLALISSAAAGAVLLRKKRS
ncbi:MAG: hypothetical protein E7632_06945 [Ruminococcaceae bacterium]|nr:hypothetical protein [Oscillospiraceae bacterium]